MRNYPVLRFHEDGRLLSFHGEISLWSDMLWH